MMKQWILMCALPCMLIACSEGEVKEQTEDATKQSHSKEVQTNEERQEEIAEMEKEIKGLVRDERTEILDRKADRLLKRYRDYIHSNPRDSMTAEYLFKAADLSVGVGKPEAAINYLDRLLTSFPTFRKAVEMWLFKAFIYETQLNDHAKAVATYEELIKRYPNHRLAEQAAASIENLRMSEEELMEKFKKQNQETAEK